MVYPLEGEATKATGRRVERFGPLTGFTLELAGKAVSVAVTTKEGGTYTLTRPSAAYKKVYAPLAEKADIAFEVCAGEGRKGGRSRAAAGLRAGGGRGAANGHGGRHPASQCLCVCCASAPGRQAPALPLSPPPRPATR